MKIRVPVQFVCSAYHDVEAENHEEASRIAEIQCFPDRETWKFEHVLSWGTRKVHQEANPKFVIRLEGDEVVMYRSLYGEETRYSAISVGKRNRLDAVNELLKTTMLQGGVYDHAPVIIHGL